MQVDWSEDYHFCRKCGNTNYNHVMEGYCQKCFDNLESDGKPHLKNSRKCLKCGQSFLSEGPGNRRCESCLRRETGYHRDSHRVNAS